VQAINLVTRESRRKSTFGRASAGYGERGRYIAGGSGNLFNGAQRISLTGQSNNANQQGFSSQDFLGEMGGGQRRRFRSGGGVRVEWGTTLADAPFGGAMELASSNLGSARHLTVQPEAPLRCLGADRVRQLSSIDPTTPTRRPSREYSRRMLAAYSITGHREFYLNANHRINLFAEFHD
jgi:hypothetical protein